MDKVRSVRKIVFKALYGPQDTVSHCRPHGHWRWVFCFLQRDLCKAICLTIHLCTVLDWSTGNFPADCPATGAGQVQQPCCVFWELVHFKHSQVRVCRLGASSQHQMPGLSRACVRVWSPLELLPDGGSSVYSDRANASTQSTLSCCRHVLLPTAPYQTLQVMVNVCMHISTTAGGTPCAQHQLFTPYVTKQACLRCRMCCACAAPNQFTAGAVRCDS